MTAASRSPNPIVLLDDSISLLRSLPAAVWLGWAAGALPFGLGVIAFTTEMTASATAAEMLPAHSLGLAALFLWMVCCQSMFSQRLRSLLVAGPAGRLSLWTMARTQALLWSTALLLIPLSALSVAGVPWAVTFYYSAAAFPDGDRKSGIRDVIRYGAAQASTWAFSSVLELGLTSLLWLVAFINAALLLVGLPVLMRSLTGQETIFTRDTEGMLNSTLLISATVLACLAMDPVLRAMYVIRCFRVDAIRTGIDLKAALARCATAATLLFIAVFLAIPPACPGATSLSINAPALDRSIREVTQRSEYVWHQPRPADLASSSNVFLTFTENTGRFIATQIRRAMTWIGEAIRVIVRWISGNQKEVDPAIGRGGPDAPFAVALLCVLIALAAGAGVALLLRVRFFGRKVPIAATATPSPALMDLNREDISPDQAHEDEWMAIAARFLEQGDLRLATRGLYLAVLASLGRDGMISIDRARSNMDYRRELARRARGNASLQQAFAEIVTVFEQTWYGRHPVSPDTFDRFRGDAMAVRGHAQG